MAYPESGTLAAAESLYQSADFSQAADAYRSACTATGPGEPEPYFEARLGLALCLDHLGAFEESERIYRDVMAAAGASPRQRSAARRNLIYAAGVRSFAAGDFGAAHANFAKALSLHPDDDELRSDILMWIGACHSQLGHFAAAGETYGDLMASDGVHESVRGQAKQRREFADGQALFAARRYREARENFERILGQRAAGNEFRSSVLLMLAHCCFHLADFRQARRRYRQILMARNASPEQKREAREWRRAVPGLVRRVLRMVEGRL